MTSFLLLGWYEASQRSRELVKPARKVAKQKPVGEIALECPEARRVLTPTGKVLLSPREWALLETLMAKPGTTLRRGELLAEVWGPKYSGTPRVVDVRVGHLRRKLEPAAGRCIETVHGVGYRFAPEAQARR